MKEIYGNILDIETGQICHQTNLKGVAGGGLAKQIRDKYPEWYKEYHKDCIEHKFLLGDCSWFVINKNLYICNMFAQDGFGTDKRYTNYFAFAECLSSIKYNLPDNIQVYFPWKISCGLGGGNWEIISEMIETAIPDAIIIKK